MSRITGFDHLAAIAAFKSAESRLTKELGIVDFLDTHRVVSIDNLGYYRSQVHCSCAAEWWSGEHAGDPSFSDMWAIHRAEVLALFILNEPKES
jgi:hypothetical protein